MLVVTSGEEPQLVEDLFEGLLVVKSIRGSKDQVGTTCGGFPLIQFRAHY